MKRFNIKDFRADSGGAITVDWVVLTGAVIGISFGIVATVFGFLEAAQETISESMPT